MKLPIGVVIHSPDVQWPGGEAKLPGAEAIRRLKLVARAPGASALLACVRAPATGGGKEADQVSALLLPGGPAVICTRSSDIKQLWTVASVSDGVPLGSDKMRSGCATRDRRARYPTDRADEGRPNTATEQARASQANHWRVGVNPRIWRLERRCLHPDARGRSYSHSSLIRNV